MTRNGLRHLAQDLLADQDARRPRRLLTPGLGLTTAAAYDLQAEISRLREERGEKLIGYKVGCVSKVIQQQLGVNEPIYGRLFDRRCQESGARISYQAHVNLAVEGELAVRLGADVPTGSLSEGDYREIIESIFVVIELHDYMHLGETAALVQLIACNGMHAGFIHGESKPFKSLDSLQDLSVGIDGTTVAVDAGSSFPSRVFGSLHWLADCLHRHGLGLHQGQVVLTGSTLPLFPVNPGNKIVVEATPLASVRAEIVS